MKFISTYTTSKLQRVRCNNTKRENRNHGNEEGCEEGCKEAREEDREEKVSTVQPETTGDAKASPKFFVWREFERAELLARCADVFQWWPTCALL